MRILLTVISFILIVTSAKAQTQPFVETSLFDLEVPNSPAFILLDQAPTSIQRPNSSKAFGLSLLQDISEDGILNDIAIEVTPFWMTTNKNRSALKFYGIDEDKKQNYFSKLNQASLSAAYTKSGDSVINISVGVRATVFELKRKEDIDAYYDSYKDIVSLLQHTQKYITKYRNEEQAEPMADEFDSSEAYQKALITYREARTKYINRKLKEEAIENGQSERMQEIINRKPAIAIDIAAAYNQRFYSNEFNENGFGRYGIWSTAAFSLFLDKKEENFNYVNIYGFVRYLVDDYNARFSEIKNDNYTAFDVGVKAELEFNKLTIGYEYISRSGDLEGYRSVGNLRYHALDNVYITGSFGNNFETQNDLITLFGIQWGFNGDSQLLRILEP